MTSNTREMGDDRRLEALALAWRMGGWVTSIPLAWWLWPDTDVRRQYSQRLLAKLIKEKLLIRRLLPTGGVAGALTQSGRDMLCLPGSGLARKPLRTGIGWGEVVKGKWQPPARWVHDERVARFLAWYRARFGSEVIFERELRAGDQRSNGLRKIPDGMIVGEGRSGIWVECEESRKTGGYRWNLIDHMARNTAGITPPLQPDHRNPVSIGPLSILVVPQEYDEEGLTRHLRKRLEVVGALEVQYRIAVDHGETFELREAQQVDLTKRPIVAPPTESNETLEIHPIAPTESTADRAAGQSNRKGEELVTFEDPYQEFTKATITVTQWSAELASLPDDERQWVIEQMTSDNKFAFHTRAGAIEEWRYRAYRREVETEVRKLPQRFQDEYERDQRCGSYWKLEDVQKRAKRVAWELEEKERKELKRREDEEAARIRAEKDKRWGGLGRFFN